MKVQYASDLHIEFPVNASFLGKIPLSAESNILVLAGDIAYIEKKMLKNHPFFDWCSRTYSYGFSKCCQIYFHHFDSTL